MATIVQQRYVTSTNGSGTVHDLPFAGAVTPGNTLLCLFFSSEDVTGATINGMAGSPAATEDANEVPGDTILVYRYTGADASATGFRLTTATAHFDAAAWILEVSGLDPTAPFIDIGLFSPDFEPIELDATAAVNAAGDLALSRFYAVTLANITSTRSGFTQSSESAGAELLQYNQNTSAGTVTAGASLSSNPGFSTSGFVVTYKASAGVPDPNRGPTDPRATKKHRRRPRRSSTIGAPVALLQSIAMSPASVAGLGVLWPPATSGFNVAVGQAQEQDQAQAIANAPRRRLVAQSSEQDAAQTITRRKARVLGQAAQTDTAQPIARIKRRAVAQALESDTAQAIARIKRRAIAQASEQDAAQSLTRRKARTVAQANEQDAAQTITVVQPASFVVSQASEQDAAQAIASRKARAIAQAAESDAAQAMTRRKARAIAQASEQDAAQAIARLKRRSVVQAQEQDSATAATRRKTRAVSQASELDTAQPVQFAGNKIIAVVQAQEQDAAQAMGRSKRRALAQASEQDAAQGIGRRKARVVSQALEQDAAQPITPIVDQTIAVGRASEQDAAQAVRPARVRGLSRASEQDAAGATTGRRSYPLAMALEIDAAQAIGFTGGRPPNGVRAARVVQSGLRPPAVQTSDRAPTMTGSRPSASPGARPPSLSTGRR